MTSPRSKRNIIGFLDVRKAMYGTDKDVHTSFAFEGKLWEFTMLRDKDDGVTLIIDSPQDLPEDIDGPKFRTVLNDAWDEPIWDNR